MGEYVVIKNFDVKPGINKKLLPRYVVKQILDHDRYVITDPEDQQ